MLVIENIKKLRSQIVFWKKQGNKVAFVPTMGCLHEGHLSLIKIAQQKADKVVVSIFVNPLQFGNNEDLARYPKTFATDKSKLEALNVDLLFFPSLNEIYPSGNQQSLVTVPSELTTILEGESRSGHFDGVTTVVAKLFNIVQPDVAIFGQKDYQQLKVIEKMVVDLAMPVDIVAGEIKRDVDGLALSSRNQYLTPKQRQIAPKLSKVLQGVVSDIYTGHADVLALELSAINKLIAFGFDSVDYVKVLDSKSLLPLYLNKNHSKLPSLVILAAARLDKIRLLDNILLKI